ncbi:MAG: fibronectin type III domain-containing protein [Candidatus Saccharibacteria bacterium]
MKYLKSLIDAWHKFTMRFRDRILILSRLYGHWRSWKYRRHSRIFLMTSLVLVIGVAVFCLVKPTSASDLVPVTGQATVVSSGQDIYFANSPYGSNVTISNWTRQMNGYVWSADFGWVNFGSNPNGPVSVSKTGVVSGAAQVLADNSYIYFNSYGANVTVSGGVFSGYAWSSDFGWINFGTVLATGYDPDISSPITNASDVKLYKSNGGASVANNGWIRTNPYFSWTAGVDNVGGSDIAGYCLYVGQDPTGNPLTAKGILGTSPLNTNGVCQFAVSSPNIDLSTAGYMGAGFLPSDLPYYINVLAIDNARNTYIGSLAQFEFNFDNVVPVNPGYISAPSQFVSNKAVNLTWPTNGSDAAIDNLSTILGLQYKIGSSGTWYGTNHTGAQDCTDLLPNNGSYTLQSSPDFANLQEGNNVIYFRTWDGACNVSATYATTVVKINATAPSSPLNLTATPETNTVNSFAFSWLPPTTYQGSSGNITYCYTVNILPTAGNCTFTPAGVTSLEAGAYATVPTDNTFYVVAKDEAGNINYATASNITFTANTPAPGIPLDLIIADVSVKVNSLWKLAISWQPPSTVGAGIANYHVYRSTDGTNYTDIASTAGASYVDSGLSQQTYHYKIKACDSANNCGAYTSAISMYPTGKFTSPATLTSGPDVVATIKTATITWTTDRNSNSQVEYGTSSEQYFPTGASNLTQNTAHTIMLSSLEAGTKYYYRVLWTDGDGNTGTSVQGDFTTLPAPTISEVAASDINLHGATVNFTTDGASSVKLFYGPNGSPAAIQTLNTSTDVSAYSIPLANLVDGTTYTYRLDPVDIDGNVYTNLTSLSFTTPPAPRITSVEFQSVPDALTSSEQISWTTNVPTTSKISYSLKDHAFSEGKEAINSTMTTKHSMVISDLVYNTPYQIIANSTDALGNTVTSDLQIFKTGLDTRPPRLSGMVVQPTIRGTDTSANGQIVVSWKTDKPATSQVAYGLGSSGDYGSKTSEDAALVIDHVVVISNLPTSQVFHLQAISKDNAGNIGESEDRTTIIGQATENVFSIVFNALRAIFGL